MFHDIEQNTDQWLQMRVGKVTGSAVSTIMANYGKAFGEPAKKYAVKIALERITGRAACVENFANESMKRGHVQEPIARKLYENRIEMLVSNGGFWDNGKTGCSPDGLVGETGLPEIKSVLGHVQFATIKRGKYDAKYKWQLVFNLRETGRDWIDYVSYSADFPEGKQLFVSRHHADEFEKDTDMVNVRLEAFELMVDEYTEICKKGAL